MKVTIETPPPVKRIVTIEMSEEEARSLLAVCSRIGGTPEYSRRKHFDSFKRELEAASITCPTNKDAGFSDIPYHQSIYLKDVEESCL